MRALFFILVSRSGAAPGPIFSANRSRETQTRSFRRTKKSAKGALRFDRLWRDASLGTLGKESQFVHVCLRRQEELGCPGCDRYLPRTSEAESQHHADAVPEARTDGLGT